MSGTHAIGQKDPVSNTFHLKNLTAIQWTGIIVTSIAVAAITAAALSYFGIGSHLFSNLGFLGANPELYTVAIASLVLCGGIIAIAKGKKGSNSAKTLLQPNSCQARHIKELDSIKVNFDRSVAKMSVISMYAAVLLKNRINGEIVEGTSDNMYLYPTFDHITFEALFQERMNNIFRLCNGAIHYFGDDLPVDVENAIKGARKYLKDISTQRTNNVDGSNPEQAASKQKLGVIPEGERPLINIRIINPEKDNIVTMFNTLHGYEKFFRERVKFDV